MCECEFKYQQDIEVSDDGENWVAKNFWGYQPESDFPYCATGGRNRIYSYAREWFPIPGYDYTREPNHPSHSPDHDHDSAWPRS